jgi:predicted phosphodiesterase
MSWEKKAEELKFDKGLSWTELAYELHSYFPELTEKQALEKIRGKLRKSDRYEGKKKDPKKPKKEKVIIFENTEPTLIDEKWAGNKIIRFGLIGDTHINSKYCQLTHLHTFYDICKEKGIGIVYHAGDIDEGEKMRPGHQYECYTQGADDHVKEIVKVYPKREGVKTKFITGNHDASMIKHCGYNIGPAIASQRDDMEYLGSDCAVINLTPNCTLELRHPWNGTSYAVSYQAQKIVEAMESDSKPNIIAIGHYHKAGEFFPRNVHTFLTGAFQSQTPFTRGKGLEVHMAGWIVEIEVDKTGTIRQITPTRIPFYKAIKDDYLNWR